MNNITTTMNNNNYMQSQLYNNNSNNQYNSNITQQPITTNIDQLQTQSQPPAQQSQQPITLSSHSKPPRPRKSTGQSTNKKRNINNDNIVDNDNIPIVDANGNITIGQLTTGSKAKKQRTTTSSRKKTQNKDISSSGDKTKTIDKQLQHNDTLSIQQQVVANSIELTRQQKLDSELKSMYNDISSLMYAYGDIAKPLNESVHTMNQCIVDIIIGCLQHAIIYDSNTHENKFRTDYILHNIQQYKALNIHIPNIDEYKVDDNNHNNNSSNS